MERRVVEGRGGEGKAVEYTGVQCIGVVWSGAGGV